MSQVVRYRDLVKKQRVEKPKPVQVDREGKYEVKIEV